MCIGDRHGADALGNALGQGLVDSMRSPEYTRDESLNDYQRERNRFVAAAQSQLAGSIGATAVPVAETSGDMIFDAAGGAGDAGSVGRVGGGSTASNPDLPEIQVPDVIINGRKWSDFEKKLYDTEHWLDGDFLAGVNQHWDAREEAAARDRNALAYVGSHVMGLLGQTGHSLARSAVGTVRLITDPRAQINTLRAVGDALTHPIETAESLYREARTFAAKPIGEQADSVFKLAAGGGATFGLGKIRTLAGDLAVAGAETRGIGGLGSPLRGERDRLLTPDEIAHVTDQWTSLGGEPSLLRFNEGRFTGASDKGVVYIRGDVFPTTSDSLHPTANLSVRETLAHEMGHMEYIDTGVAPGAWNDEFRASFWAARNVPGLTEQEQFNLVRDAMQRAQDAGVTVKMNSYIRGLLYGF